MATTKRKHAAKRELIDTGRDKRYVRRDERGRFDEVDDMHRSLSQDRKRHAKTAAKPGQGDRGDRKPAKSRSKLPSEGDRSSQFRHLFAQRGRERLACAANVGPGIFFELASAPSAAGAGSWTHQLHLVDCRPRK